jgi:hypothetical protein
MKRITAFMAATAAMAITAAPAHASLPVPGQDGAAGLTQGLESVVGEVTGGTGGNAGTGNTQVLNGNSAAVSATGDPRSEGGDTYAKSGDAYAGDGGDARSGGKGRAQGGDGGDARTGNRQAGNGNSLAIAPGRGPERSSCGKCGREHRPEARSEGGDTHAKSGDAYGGRGGDAKASGRYRYEGDHKRGCDRSRGKGDRGGHGSAEGGDGGDAHTGNVQFLNGNSLALALFGDAGSEGGDTYAKSGDAYGGDGGSAEVRR